MHMHRSNSGWINRSILPVRSMERNHTFLARLIDNDICIAEPHTATERNHTAKVFEQTTL